MQHQANNKLAYHFFGRATAIITIDTLYRKNLLHQLVQHFQVGGVQWSTPAPAGVHQVHEIQIHFEG
jgi:hypothetical protein